jgi:NADPH:quinone reductase-like Zn-dependent oxidoreductase
LKWLTVNAEHSHNLRIVPSLFHSGETTMTMMKAVQIHAYGEPKVLSYEETARPAPKPDEVLIHVHAAAINPLDSMIRAGSEMIHPSFPLILGVDVAGVIEGVGDEVKEFQVGDAVYAMVGLQFGGYAEYVVAPASAVAPKPNSLDFIQAASVPLAALTAWQSLFEHANLSAGQRVLIQAAAGGVGSSAVQFAKAKGAYVIGIASTKKQALVKELGADEVVDYRNTRFEEVVHDVDVVLDLVGGETQERSFQVLKPGGILVSTVSEPDVDKAKLCGICSTHVMFHESSTQLREIAKLIDAGQVKTVIGTVLPLQEVRKGQEMLQKGQAQGKIVLQVAN